MLSPFAFDRHRWKLVVSGYEMSEKDVLILLDTLGYLEFSMPRERAR